MKQKDCKILLGINKDTDQLHYIHTAHLCLLVYLKVLNNQSIVPPLLGIEPGSPAS